MEKNDAYKVIAFSGILIAVIMIIIMIITFCHSHVIEGKITNGTELAISLIMSFATLIVTFAALISLIIAIQNWSQAEFVFKHAGTIRKITKEAEEENKKIKMRATVQESILDSFVMRDLINSYKETVMNLTLDNEKRRLALKALEELGKENVEAKDIYDKIRIVI